MTEKTKPTVEDFDSFVSLVLDNLPYGGQREWYGSDAEVAEELLIRVRDRFYAEEKAREERYAQYLQLKAEFEGDS